MKIEIVLARDGIDADISAEDGSGNETDVSTITLKPYLANADGAGNILFFRVLTNKGRVVRRGRLVVSGSNGQCRVHEIKNSTQARVDQAEEEVKA